METKGEGEIEFMEKMILAGNSISLLAACFTAASSWSKEKKHIYLYQTVQCFLLAIANVFFASFSGCVTLFLCSIRNLLTAYDKFTGRLCGIFLVLILVPGILTNNRGLTGLIPVVTTVIYTVGCLYLKTEKKIKGNIIINQILWSIYDILILDIVSFGVDMASALIAVIALFRKEESL